jgi:hypothetical protein
MLHIKYKQLRTYTWNGSVSHNFNITTLKFMLINFVFFRIVMCFLEF